MCQRFSMVLVSSRTMTPPGTLAMVLHLSKAVHRASSDELLGMRLRQFLVLSYLRERSPSRQQDLCETLMLDANNCVLLLNELENAGWTQRRRDPEDRRRHVVELTAAGREALDRARRAQETLEDDVLSALEPDEREQLRALLQKALRGLHERAGQLSRAG
jgi:DNA-binding MarR family transcriptional regulator